MRRLVLPGLLWRGVDADQTDAAVKLRMVVGNPVGRFALGSFPGGRAQGDVLRRVVFRSPFKRETADASAFL